MTGRKEIHFLMLKYIKVPGTLHEFGCGAGRNLQWLKKDLPDLTITGNEINEKVVTKYCHPKGLEVEAVNTIHWLKRKRKMYDYFLSVAHLVHIPNEFDEVLNLHVHRLLKVGGYLFLWEYKDHGQSSGLKYCRDYRTFFPKGLKLIEEKNSEKNGSYEMLVFLKEK